MTFKELRSYMRNRHRKTQLIRWNRSGIVEAVLLSDNGALLVYNLITGRSYPIPRRYADIDIATLELSESVSLGSLLPKGM